MYTEFFGLNEKPFSITPDPRYLYMSQRHTDALAHLIYGISESGGFIQLTGEVGTGKTTLIRSLLEQLPEKAEIALILNPQLTALEFLQGICAELRIPQPSDSSLKALIDVLNDQLLSAHAEGRRIVLIVDEAQTLSTELLEQVRLLTNLETATQKLLQIILIGQPELRELLDRAEMRQLAQRVTGRYHLEPLSKEDAAAYIKHRMRVAGSQGEVFTRSALRELYRKSAGIPRLINVVADRALLAAYTRDQSKVDGPLVRRAAAEVFGRRRHAGRWWPWAAVGVGLASFALATTNLWQAATEERLEASVVSARSAPPAEPAAALPTPRPPPAEQPPQAETRPAEAKQAKPRLGELFGQTSFASNADAAVGELLELWGARYEPARGAPCRQAAAQGLRCLFQQAGSIAELRAMNRPVVLSLTDDRGTSHDVVLGALGYDSADLISGGGVFQVDLAELTHYWYGDHLLLWRPATRQGRDLIPGMQDEDVLWLRESLARIRGEPAPSDRSTVYDAQLAAHVRDYQRQRRLTVDGIVGARTQIALTTDLGTPEAPLLIKSH